VSRKPSCTVLRGGAVGNDGSLLDPDTPSGKQPWYFTARDGSPLLTIAGLWDSWNNKETGERIKSCTMIISEPNDFVAEVHDRMPVQSRQTNSSIG
jgi:putative SOS response-associated peptidase YedK